MIEEEGVDVLELGEPRVNGGGRGESLAGLAGEGAQGAPASEPMLDDASDVVWRDRVVVAAIAGATDALDDAALQKATGVGAHAGLAHAEERGEVIEGAWLLGGDQESEEAAGNAWQSVGLGGEPHLLHEPLDVWM